MGETDRMRFTDPGNYVNRELSWLEFDGRVLGEALDPMTPLFDRLKFLSISASNLDEFFMVRVASLKDMVHARYTKLDIAGLTPEEQLSKINVKTHELVKKQYDTYNKVLLPALEENGIHVVLRHEELTQEQKEFADRYFKDEVYPVLTPMAVDSSRPFPLVRNKSLNLAALLRKKSGDGELEFAMVQVPSVLPRVVVLPMTVGEHAREIHQVILLEEIIERNMQQLFLNYDIVTSHPFRIMRNADFSLDEEESVDLLEEIEKTALRLETVQDVLLEVNIGEEAAKRGFVPAELLSGAEAALEKSHIRVLGLMTIPPAEAEREENLRYFDKVRALFLDMNEKLFHNSLQVLSMGMSGDYEDAVRAGATMVRVGTAIFGSRHYT